MIAVVIPCYRVKSQISGVIDRIGPEVGKIIVVDDCCPEASGRFVKESIRDPRIDVVFHEKNQGVGGAMVSGFRRALELNASIIVKIDGDGQMDPTLLPQFVRPIQEGRADYTKGNRFFDLRSLESMPAIRLFGNTALSFLAKIATGYWGIMDPTNGYLAIHSRCLSMVPLEKLARDYFFETDLLFRLNTLRAVVRDVPMKAIYADEKSSLRIGRILFQFPPKYFRCFLKRIFYTYFLRDFNAATVELLLGLPLFLFGIGFGAWKWIEYGEAGAPTPTGTIMLSVLPIILGFQLLISVVNFDITNTPKEPIQKQFG